MSLIHKNNKTMKNKIFLLAVVIAIFIALLTIAGLLIGGVGSTYALSCPSSPLIYIHKSSNPSMSLHIYNIINIKGQVLNRLKNNFFIFLIFKIITDDQFFNNRLSSLIFNSSYENSQIVLTNSFML